MLDEEEEMIIINKEYYEGIKKIVTCPICCLIIQNPFQCNKCQNFFCSKCINDWSIKSNNCPYKCMENEYISSRICKNLISQIKVKCKCGKEMEYDIYMGHKEKCCKGEDINQKYLLLKEKYDKLLEKSQKYDELLDKINKEENENKEFISNAYILFSSHKHKLKILRRFVTPWICSECYSKFKTDDPSYHCTLCDYDICYYCSLKLNPIKGRIHQGMIDYYNNQK